MSFNWKGAVVKLFAAGAIGAMIWQAVAYIDPIVKDNYMKHGSCNITYLNWGTQFCDATASYVYVPIFFGYVTFNSTGLSTSYDYFSYSSDVPTYDSEAGADVQSFLYDDESGTLLVPDFNCSTATVRTSKALVVRYFPQLSGVVDVNDSYPNVKWISNTSQFACYYQDHYSYYRAVLVHVATNKIMIFPFVLTLGLVILGLHLIQKYDDDGPVKEFAEFILSLLVIFFYFIHMALYTIFFVVIGQILFNITPSVDAEDAWKAGSVFFPFIKLYKYLKRRHEERQVEQELPAGASAAAEERARPTERRSSLRSTTPPRGSNMTEERRSSLTGHRTVRFASEIPNLTKPPSYPSFETGMVVPNLTAVDQGDDIMLPPPPSYDEVIRNDQYNT